MRTLCIWWTAQSDTEKIGEHGLDDRDIPEYLKDGFKSRFGRSVRGQLWISSELDSAPSEVPWDETKIACRLIVKEGMGGIVMRREDVFFLPKGVGFITDLNCDPITPTDERVEKALEYINKYGGMLNGPERKQWMLDQVVRALTGCPMVVKAALDAHRKPYTYDAQGESDEYREWVRSHCDGEDGPETYDWDIGTPP